MELNPKGDLNRLGDASAAKPLPRVQTAGSTDIAEPPARSHEPSSLQFSHARSEFDRYGANAADDTQLPPPPAAPTDFTNAHIAGAGAAMTFLAAIGARGIELVESLATTGEGTLGNQEVSVSDDDLAAVAGLPGGQRGPVLVQLVIMRLLDPSRTFNLALNPAGPDQLPWLVDDQGAFVEGASPDHIQDFYQTNGISYMRQEEFLDALNQQEDGDTPEGALAVFNQLAADAGGHPCFSVSIDGQHYEVQLDHIVDGVAYLADQPGGGIAVPVNELISALSGSGNVYAGLAPGRKATRWPS